MYQNFLSNAPRYIKILNVNHKKNKNIIILYYVFLIVGLLLVLNDQQYFSDRSTRPGDIVVTPKLHDWTYYNPPCSK